MFKNRSLLLILVVALALLASPALAQDRVDKLVITKGLEDGYQFEAVFQPGEYILFPRVKGSSAVASLKLHVVNNPSPACFIRGEHNGREPVDEADRLTLESRGVWRYFELGDTCYLRFEVRDYEFGAVNIRRVGRVDRHIAWNNNGSFIIARFAKGRWSSSAKFGEFNIQVLNTSYPACHFATTPSGRNVGLMYSYDRIVDRDETWTFELAETCVTAIRANLAHHALAHRDFIELAFVRVK